MTANEFMSKLEEALRGEVPVSVLESNLRYYRSYIEEERGKGHSDTDILGDLGDPRLIARTIIKTQSLEGSRADYRENYQRMDSREYCREEDRSDRRDSWKLPLIVVLVLVAVVLIIGSVFGLAVRILLSPAFWIIVFVIFFLRFISGRRQ